MCGIAGIFSYHDAAPDVDRDELRLIRDYMAVRGPDGSGEWFAPDARVALGHRRLAIIDLSPGASQPMTSPDGRCVISFNGEIYNYREIRADLECRGHHFRTQSDTEVLLALYADKGIGMFQDLRGMFAFALWDGREKRMLLARDPYGIKPLYYADDGRTLRAASQVKALLASPKISKEPDPAGTTGFFLWGSVPEPFTLYEKIQTVPAGSFIWAGRSGISEIQTYFSIAEIYRGATEDKQMPANLEQQNSLVIEALLDSVKHHFVADVPVGLFLSSGVDSSALLALAAQAGFSSLQTVTLAFDEYQGTSRDELPAAVETAKSFGTRHHVLRLNRKDFERELPKVLQAMDQPTIDGVNTYFVSKAAAAAGLKVVLSGVGGDELFGGYSSFEVIPKWVSALVLPSRIPGLGSLFRGGVESVLSPLKIFHPKFAGLLELGGTYAGAYLLKRGLFMPWELDRLLERETVRRGLERLCLLKRLNQTLDPDPGTAYGRVAALESCWYLKNQLLRDTDWAGMAHSLEIRTPWVDVFLLKKMVPLVLRQGSGEPKKILKNALQGILPGALRNRPKTGFHLPMESWLEATNREMLRKNKAELAPWPRAWANRLYAEKAA